MEFHPFGGSNLVEGLAEAAGAFESKQGVARGSGGRFAATLDALVHGQRLLVDGTLGRYDWFGVGIHHPIVVIKVRQATGVRFPFGLGFDNHLGSALRTIASRSSSIAAHFAARLAIVHHRFDCGCQLFATMSTSSRHDLQLFELEKSEHEAFS